MFSRLERPLRTTMCAWCARNTFLRYTNMRLQPDGKLGKTRIGSLVKLRSFSIWNGRIESARDTKMQYAAFTVCNGNDGAFGRKETEMTGRDVERRTLQLPRLPAYTCCGWCVCKPRYGSAINRIYTRSGASKRADVAFLPPPRFVPHGSFPPVKCTSSVGIVA